MLQRIGLKGVSNSLPDGLRVHFALIELAQMVKMTVMNMGCRNWFLTLCARTRCVVVLSGLTREVWAARHKRNNRPTETKIVGNLEHNQRAQETDK